MGLAFLFKWRFNPWVAKSWTLWPNSEEIIIFDSYKVGRKSRNLWRCRIFHYKIIWSFIIKFGVCLITERIYFVLKWYIIYMDENNSPHNSSSFPHMHFNVLQLLLPSSLWFPASGRRRPQPCAAVGNNNFPVKNLQDIHL